MSGPLVQREMNTSGLPSQLNFSVSQATINIEGYKIQGTPNTYTVIASDRLGNPVPDGTAINFIAEGGQIQAIRQKADKDLTDGDKKKLEETEKYFREAQGRLAAMKEDLTAQITQFGKTQTDELMKRFRVSVTKVAEQKGIAIVFSNEVALYAGTDITDTVLNDLNKK